MLAFVRGPKRKTISHASALKSTPAVVVELAADRSRPANNGKMNLDLQIREILGDKGGV